MNPLFSIIIPTFNRAENLKKCLNSLVSQSFSDFEVIVCDDGSTDNTSGVVNSYRDKLSIVYSFEENWGGPAVPRNRGIDLAKGKWVCFLDSDDWYVEERLKFLSEVVKQDYDIYHHRLISVSSEGKYGFPFCRQIDNSKSGEDLLTNFSGILTSSTCVLRESLIANDLYFSENKQIIGIEDFDLWIRAGFADLKFKFLNKKMGFYFLEGKDSISYKDERQAKRLDVLYQSYQHILKKKYQKKSLAALDYQKACIFLNIDRKKSVDLFIQAFKGGTINVKMRCVFRMIKYYI